MHKLNDYMRQIEKEYQVEFDKANAEIKLLPIGNLKRRIVDGAICYIQVVSGSEKGISKDWDLISKLARKRCLINYLKISQSNIRLIQKFQEQYKSPDLKEIVQGLSSTYRSLPLELFYPCDKRDWSNDNYKSNPFKKEDCTIFTNSGVPVRSKSEQAIGNTLEAMEIQYHYEEKFEADGQNRYPDFTIQQPSTGNRIYWEHWGCTDQEEYINNMNLKMRFYRRNDLIPWKNLICTFEEDTRDGRRIHEIIQNMIL